MQSVITINLRPVLSDNSPFQNTLTSNRNIAVTKSSYCGQKSPRYLRADFGMVSGNLNVVFFAYARE